MEEGDRQRDGFGASSQVGEEGEEDRGEMGDWARSRDWDHGTCGMQWSDYREWDRATDQGRGHRMWVRD